MTHVHVEDVARACVTALEHSDAIGKVFNVADAKPVAWSEVVIAIERFLGVAERAPMRIHPLAARGLKLVSRLRPRWFARVNGSLARRWNVLVDAQALVPALRPRVDIEAYDYWSRDHVYDASALRALGWTPRWPDALEGLLATLRWYVEQRWLPTPLR
jgi:nucleoside-diphosphate-sugar epimerase